MWWLRFFARRRPGRPARLVRSDREWEDSRRSGCCLPARTLCTSRPASGRNRLGIEQRWALAVEESRIPRGLRGRPVESQRSLTSAGADEGGGWGGRAAAVGRRGAEAAVPVVRCSFGGRKGDGGILQNVEFDRVPLSFPSSASGGSPTTHHVSGLGRVPATSLILRACRLPATSRGRHECVRHDKWRTTPVMTIRLSVARAIGSGPASVHHLP